MPDLNDLNGPAVGFASGVENIGFDAAASAVKGGDPAALSRRRFDGEAVADKQVGALIGPARGGERAFRHDRARHMAFVTVADIAQHLDAGRRTQRHRQLADIGRGGEGRQRRRDIVEAAHQHLGHRRIGRPADHDRDARNRRFRRRAVRILPSHIVERSLAVAVEEAHDNGKIVADAAYLRDDHHVGGDDGGQFLPVAAFRHGGPGIGGQHPQPVVGDIGNAAIALVRRELEGLTVDDEIARRPFRGPEDAGQHRIQRHPDILVDLGAPRCGQYHGEPDGQGGAEEMNGNARPLCHITSPPERRRRRDRRNRWLHPGFPGAASDRSHGAWCRCCAR
ncbi:hypothetical protein RHE_PE00152 (plasmid) [Rhizobium etli CFN 42]|uniref:Uncharacterized protein n=1 Tax=Rhizobium etli (strain ATCC 51251 / DSM 11541 / JCM 21823 / NBRC 15573 / CFN 42) TaxID=347834 RepID=Q2K0E3_RHIEC|nr:hypothetical protein RHE_PE00152 [Rhizobium etli CFN 42]